ncbi:hypothetical protein [Tunturiibacter gelidiferens]|uniref:hypothetical protein n=1 Tax=Tunturiibacter gelidiferens TaxID=3069689 RepID=UPI003D9B7686
MRLKLRFDSLKETKPTEYVSRFVFGGVVTVLAGFVADHCGPVLGGLFLAFPGIFPAGVSLVEKHKTQREKTEGKLGIWSARGQASVEAAGASVGTLGLMGFAVVLWQGLPTHNFLPIVFTATGTWIAVSSLFWWTRERM